MLAQTDSIADTRELKAVVVKATNGIKSRFRVDNAEIIGQGQLIRAACCNLGESFTANPSVDVSYSDAATGAKQIKLLGLSGTYVQMLTENVPNLRGAALPYSLGYVPGPWMQSIQVSKGASSVKNGYESTTGQINIEFLKPQGIDGVRANVYQDSELKTEVNLDGSVHLNERLSTATLLHFENRQMDHDGNGDGFMDIREFHRFSLYVGGENLTNYKIDDPIRHAHHPWSAAFDATQVWGPVTGAMAYVGVRFKLEKL